MNIATRLKKAQERDDIIRAIQGFDLEALQSLIEKGVNIKRLGSDKKLVWHLQRNFLPEADNLEAYNEDDRERLEEISQRLSKGNEILRILAHAGLFIPEIGKNYAQYSLYELEEKYFDDDVDISRYNARAVMNYECFKYIGKKNPEGALWQATSPEALRIMLAGGADVNLCDSSGWTALHHVAFAPIGKYFRPVEMIKILLEAGVNVNARSRDDITPLMVALNGLAQNINVSFSSNDYTDSINIIALLAKNGADPKVSDKYNNDIYFWAGVEPHGSNTHEIFVEEIAEYPHMQEDEFDLITSVFAGDINAVKKILSKNLNVNIQTLSGDTPLMFALENENNDLMSFLLEHGSDPNIQNERGETVLHKAVCDESNMEKIELLLNHGADPNIKNKLGYAPINLIFRYSLNHKALEIAKVLLEHKADPDSREKDGTTLLMRCVNLEKLYEYDDNVMCGMKLLLEAGADINAQDSEGNTPLMYAAEGNDEVQFNVIKAILVNGADPSLKNYEGNSALDIFLDNDWRTQDDTYNFESLILLLKQGLYLNSHEIQVRSDHENFLEKSMNAEVRIFGLEGGKSFAEVIAKNSIENLIRAVNSGLSVSLQDKNGITLPEAALNSREVDILKACIRTGERNRSYNVKRISEDLLVIAMKNYDVEGVKILLEVGINPEFAKTFTWRFKANYIPEANDNEAAKNFKRRLDRGTEILNILHEVMPEIPNHDTDGKELSYTYVGKKSQKDWDTELLPLKDDEVSHLRHGVSVEAIIETISPELDFNFDFSEDFEADTPNISTYEYDENESFKAVTREISQKFSPEDFVTRTDEEEQERREFLESLLEADNIGKNILHLVALNHREYFEPANIITLLIACGSDINMRDADGLTPALTLIKDCLYCSDGENFSAEALECLCEFIRQGTDLTLKDEKGFSIKKFISDENYLNDDKFGRNICFGADNVRRLIFIDILQTMIDESDCDDSSILIYSFGHDVQKISDAISISDDIETRTKKGYTPLMIASMFGTTETVKFLIEKGADVNAYDRFGNNLIALNVAAGEAKHDIIFVLAEAGVDVNSQNNEGLTPLMQTVMEYSNCGNKLRKIRMLLSVGADPDITNNDGENVMTMAAQNGRYRALKELLLAGISPEIRI